MELTDLYLGNAIYTEPSTMQAVNLGIAETDNTAVTSFPVEVFDSNMNSVGFANNKQEYMDLWNANNAAIGHLVGDYNPFSFVLYHYGNITTLPTSLYGNFGYLVRIDGSPVIMDGNQIIIR